MNKNIVKSISLLLNFIHEKWCYLYLKTLKLVPIVGNGVTFQKGFRLYNGARNLKLGSNINLVDVLINAGDTSNGSISIGNHVFFGHGVMLLSRGHDYKKRGEARQKNITEKQIVIGDGVWLGSRTVVLGGVTIGNNSVTAAGSIVTKSIPENTIYGGVPAKKIMDI